MGKIDDLRRRREQNYADMERASSKPSPHANGVSPKPPDAALAARVESAPAASPEAKKPSRSARAAAADEQAKCAGCGKLRAVHDGVIASHQKGLGKMCPGSRKKPA